MDWPRHNDQLAVKMIGKKIKKETPLHLPNGYTSKNRLRRSIVPPLTSSPKIRPAALINRPHDVPPPPAMTQPTHNLARPPMMGHADQFWSNIAAESPVSFSLQSSSGDSRSSGNQMQQSHQYQSHSPLIYNKSLPSARFSGGGILPTPVSVCIPSPQSSFGDSGPNRNQMKPSHDYQKPPRFNGSASSVPILPSPWFDGPGILPTPPTSFTSSSMAQAGILGPGKFPRPPHASTGLVFSPLPFGENTS
ncbi:hypothetical protein Bca4012_072970 [Brassica carinata]|uniref:Uncharacterized protein n=3 Tax=Brassica TaxID=3705 RepID=A0A8X7QI84_BRACI|nr:protein HAIKU1 [Brassica napus]KAG2270755.1 hypothetical protein Bca52824_065310 [Brassica carinata]CAF1930507.1 unnamed protein product [Brassica napus]VDD45027.1 unnamed protein product [Brassica oleracea]